MNRAHSAVLDQTDMAITPSGLRPRCGDVVAHHDQDGRGRQGVRGSPRRDQVGAALDLDAEPLGLGEHAGDLALVQVGLGPQPAAGGGQSRVRGSVILPVRALAAAVDGEHRYTASPAVPLRPGKLRLKAATAGRRPGPGQCRCRACRSAQHPRAGRQQVLGDAGAADDVENLATLGSR